MSYGIPYMWNIKINYTNELIYKTERLIDLENKFMVTKGKKGWGEINKKCGINRCMHVCSVTSVVSDSLQP